MAANLWERFSINFIALSLGYFAGKRNAFDADQAAGLSKLALSFALPASLFVSMTDIISARSSIRARGRYEVTNANRYR